MRTALPRMAFACAVADMATMSAAMKPTLLVLAAGMGSRYGGLKQIDPVGPSGETLLDYSVYDAIRAGFGRVVFVIRRDIDAEFRDKVGARYAGAVPVEYVYQELDALPDGFSVPDGRTKPWGTGHAILVAKDAVKEPFAVINGDDFYGRDAFEQLAKHLQTVNTDGLQLAMVAYALKNTLSDHGTVSRGVCTVSKEGLLATVEEVTAIQRECCGGATAKEADGDVRMFKGTELVSMNLWGFSPLLFVELERQFKAFLEARGGEEKSEFYIPFAIDELVQQGKATVQVLKTSSVWCGVTYREDKPIVQQRLQQMIDAGDYPASLSL